MINYQTPFFGSFGGKIEVSNSSKLLSLEDFWTNPHGHESKKKTLGTSFGAYFLFPIGLLSTLSTLTHSHMVSLVIEEIQSIHWQSLAKISRTSYCADR